MQLNLQEVPFSMRGSYMAVSYHEKNFRGSGMAEGLYLRTVHGDAGTPFVARLQTLNDGEECPCRIEAQPEKVTLSTQKGEVFLAYEDADTLLISGRGDGVGIRLDFLPGEY